MLRLSLLDRQSARVRQTMFLLVEVPLAEVLLIEVLPVVEGETVLVVSGLLEKREKIPLGSVTSEEGEVLLFSSASLGFRYSWGLFSLAGWTGGHRQSYFWSLPMCQYADTTVKSFVSTGIPRYKNGIGIS